jgi:hypothetical protein
MRILQWNRRSQCCRYLIHDIPLLFLPPMERQFLSYLQKEMSSFNELGTENYDHQIESRRMSFNLEYLSLD